MRSQLLIFLIAAFLPSISQDICDTENRHRMLLAEDPAYVEALRPILDNSREEEDSGQILTIPLVVHVIHLGEAEGWGSNISNGQIYRAIGRLNRDYQYAFGYDTGLRFCMAKQDPEGRPTNGIVRVDGRGVADYQTLGLESSEGPGANETDVKDLSRWPNTEYYNIWVVHNIAGAVAGFAYYPTTYINDGTTIEALTMSALFTTLTHELGHAFNLRHTFQGDVGGSTCPANDDCEFQGDLCCDTPPHKRDDCFVNNPCQPGGSDFPNSANNFMSYCIQSNRFTADQRQRIRDAVLSYPRNLLAASDACDEFPQLDGRLARITHPLEGTNNNYCDSISGRFVLANEGASVIDQFSVSYRFDGPEQTAGFSTDLAPGDSAEFELPAESLNTAIDFHDMAIRISEVNMNFDENPNNDSAQIVYDINDTCGITTAAAFNELELLRFYPNPVTEGVFTIEGLSANGDLDFLLTDLLGREVDVKVERGETTQLNLGQLTPGTYLLSIRLGSNSKTVSLIKL